MALSVQAESWRFFSFPHTWATTFGRLPMIKHDVTQVCRDQTVFKYVSNKLLSFFHQITFFRHFVLSSFDFMNEKSISGSEGDSEISHPTIKITPRKLNYSSRWKLTNQEQTAEAHILTVWETNFCFAEETWYLKSRKKLQVTVRDSEQLFSSQCFCCSFLFGFEKTVSLLFSFFFSLGLSQILLTSVHVPAAFQLLD